MNFLAIKAILGMISGVTDDAEEAKIILKKSLAFLEGHKSTPKGEELKKIFDYLDFEASCKREEGTSHMKAASGKAATAIVDILIAERMISLGDYKDAADSLLQAKVLISSLLSANEMKLLIKMADDLIEAEKQQSRVVKE